MPSEYGVLQREPKYKVDEFVYELMGRRDETIDALHDELKGLLLGLIDQFSILKKHNSAIDLRSIRFERIRWTLDGQLVMNITHNKKPFTPKEAKWE